MHESRSSQAAFERLVALGRRWRIFAPFAIVTPLIVYTLVGSTPPTYQSSADVLLTRQGLAISGLQDATFWTPARTIRTQVQLARLPDVSRRVVVAAELYDVGAFGFLGQSSVVADDGTDLMTFQVRDGDSELAARLATIYAEQYIAYRKELDTKSLRRAIAVIDGQLERLRAQGADPSTYANLVQNQQRLHTGLATLEGNATLVRPAIDATRIAPEPGRASLEALALGLVVGLGLALLVGLLDTRARTADEISEQLRLPLLGRLLVQRRKRRRPDKLDLLRWGDEPAADSIRALRANFELEARERRDGVVMVTSSVVGEGKSTTVANLSVALALSGRNVVLVDLDLRHPTISRLFDLPRSPGVTDLVHGTAELDEVVHGVPLDRLCGKAGSGAHFEEEATRGTLRVVTAGRILPYTTDIVSRPELPTTLQSLLGSADIVLVDGPPLLLASDALTLSTYVDALLFVAHTKMYRRTYAGEIGRLLALSPTAVLGLVVIGEPRELEPVPRYEHVDRHDPDRSLPALERA